MFDQASKKVLALLAKSAAIGVGLGVVTDQANRFAGVEIFNGDLMTLVGPLTAGLWFYHHLLKPPGGGNPAKQVRQPRAQES